MAQIPDIDLQDDLCEQLDLVIANGVPIEIIAGGSKCFYGEAMSADLLAIDVSGHSGVIDYDPAELVISLRAGCKLRDVEALLSEHGQMFAFEPPSYTEDSTIGGMLATGLTGPRRAFSGQMRDHVVGMTIIDGRGDKLKFGGRVIKNVAGFDISRLMVGALGTLGIILEASIRVIPKFESEVSLSFEHKTAHDHIQWINQLLSLPYPISASLWHGGTSEIRLSASEQGVQQAIKQLGGEAGESNWGQLKQQTHEFFKLDAPLYRIALPATMGDIFEQQDQLLEWAGAQRWVCGSVELSQLRPKVEILGGNVCAFKNQPIVDGVFHPQTAAITALTKNLKSSFDPQGIFNPGRLYPGL